MSKDQNAKFNAEVRRVTEKQRRTAGPPAPGNDHRSVRHAQGADASMDLGSVSKEFSDCIYRAISRAMDSKIQEILALHRTGDGKEAFVASVDFARHHYAGDPEADVASRRTRVAEPSRSVDEYADEKKKMSASLASVRERLMSSEEGDNQNALLHEASLSPNRKERPSAAHVTAKHTNSIHSRIQELSRALSIEKSRYDSAKGEIEKLSSEIQFLQSQLKVLHQESQQSKLQIGELSGKLAKLNGPPEVESNQSLTWEERKLALLQQLEAECEVSNRDRRDELLEVQNVIEETSELMQHKDSEIKALKALLEQQSISRDSLAIGASAVGGIVELDELIIAERQKLRGLREQWEERQRQFEIEMSLERAKLARERSTLQEEQWEASNRQTSFATDPSANRSGQESNHYPRWLAHLGLQND